MSTTDDNGRFIGRVKAAGDIVTADDGFRYYWPSRDGAVSAQGLRLIADELDRLNRAWEEQIDRDLG